MSHRCKVIWIFLMWLPLAPGNAHFFFNQKVMNFFLFSMKTYVLVLIRSTVLLMNIKTYVFRGEIRKVYCGYPSYLEIWITVKISIYRHWTVYNAVFNLITALLKKPTDLDLHSLSLNIWISMKNPDQVIWLAGK